MVLSQSIGGNYMRVVKEHNVCANSGQLTQLTENRLRRKKKSTTWNSCKLLNLQFITYNQSQKKDVLIFPSKNCSKSYELKNIYTINGDCL